MANGLTYLLVFATLCAVDCFAWPNLNGDETHRHRDVVDDCRSLEDCNRAGECESGKCVCDPGWTGSSCQLLDLMPQPSPASGAAWNSRTSKNSSWCITAPRAESGVKPGARSGQEFHIFVSEMVPGCGLGTWLPGSRIIHAVSSEGIEGPYRWKEQVSLCPSGEFYSDV